MTRPFGTTSPRTKHHATSGSACSVRLKTWNPQDIAPDKNPKFSSRLVVVQKAPFTSDKWVHIAVTHSALGSGKGHAKLYLNGQLIGATPEITEKFQWDMNKAAIRIGVGYVGLFDELSIYDRELSAAEIAKLSRN